MSSVTARPSSPGELTCKDTEVKVEPGSLMGEARAITEYMRLGARGVTAEWARGEMVGKSRGGDGLVFPVPP